MILPNDFKEFLRLLNLKNVRYLLVGGYAVSLYGYPRPTGDLDLWVDPSTENAPRLVEAIREFGFDTPQLSEALFTGQNRIVRMGNPPLRIELLTSLSGVQFEECYARRSIFTLDDLGVATIALEDLRRNKRAAGRLKDLADLEVLGE